jgi:hypothetical protein
MGVIGNFSISFDVFFDDIDPAPELIVRLQVRDVIIGLTDDPGSARESWPCPVMQKAIPDV